MPTVSLTLSAAAANEVNDAFASLYSYQATIQTGVDGDGHPVMGANTETKAQFVKRKMIEFVKERVMTYRRQVALAAVSATDSDIT